MVLRLIRSSYHYRKACDSCVDNITRVLVMNPRKGGARCSSVVRAFAHGAMDRRIDPSWLTHLAISCSNHCSTTGAILSVGWCI